jgi:endonuclease
VKRFNIVISKEDGGVEVYPMKEWLRQHPEHLPSGLDATSSTSHQLRSALRRLGWLVQETPSEVRLIPSGGRATETTIDAVLGEDATSDEAETPEASFGLEFQLRDFIAQNLSAIDVKGKKLQLYVDHTGRDGIEFPTAVGSIDILAVDDSAAFYVFELKRAKSGSCDRSADSLHGLGSTDHREASPSERGHRREGHRRQASLRRLSGPKRQSF